MRWKNIGVISAALTAMLFAGLFGVPTSRWVQGELARRAEAPDPIMATADETRAILAAVLAHHLYKGVPPPPSAPGDPPREARAHTLTLSDHSLCLYRSTPHAPCGDGDTLVLYPELDSIAPLKLRTELVMANRDVQPVAVDGIPGTRVEAQADIDRTLGQPGGWSTFYRQFADSAGLVRITQPVLGHDRSRALILVDHLCDGLCGSVTLFALERRELQWRVSGELQLAVR